MSQSQPNAPAERVAVLLDNKSVYDLRKDLQNGELWLKLAAVAAFLAAAFFVVKYFVGGDMHPETWTGEQWANATLGLGITAVITAAQAFLYSSGYQGPAATVATIIVVFFGLFADISQSMEREDATVRHRSENSQVFQAALGSIGTISASGQVLSGEQKALADTQAQLQHWQALKADKTANPSRVVQSHKVIDRNIARLQQNYLSLQQQNHMQAQNRATLLTGAIAQAKALEYDEDKHYAMIRLLKDMFGVSGVWASFLFSLIIIGTFEYAFNFVGGYVTDHKKALRALGLDTQGNPIHPQAKHEVIAQRHIPKDYANNLREQYLKTAKTTEPAPSVELSQPDFTQTKATVSASHETPSAHSTPKQVEENPAAHTHTLHTEPMMDSTRTQLFKLTFLAVRKAVLNGDLKPTVRPVTDAVTQVIRQHTKTLGLQPALIGKPERQKMAEQILEKLAQEHILTLNTDIGIGKPKYLLVNSQQAKSYTSAVSIT
jgi:hypothetical protein